MNIKMVIAYLGSSYAGWQQTPTGSSIEETLRQALIKILQHPVTLQAASRTDSGVHAEGQVVNFFMQKEMPLDRLHIALNSTLPKEVAVLSIEEMPPSFHPTVDALGKEYRYQICNAPIQLPFYKDTSWHFFYPLDMEKMQRAAGHLVGVHDFSAFCYKSKFSDRNPICHLEKIEIAWLPQNRLEISLCGNRFLHRMARGLTGTIAYAGCGKLDPDQIPTILKNKDRRLAAVTAPASGLTLKRVFYKNDIL